MAHMNQLEADITASEKEIFGSPTSTPVPDAAVPAVVPVEGASPEPEVTPVAEPVAQPTPQVVAPEPTTVQEPVAIVDDGAVKPATPQPDTEDWKKRYTNFKASSDATIHGLRQESVYLRQQVEGLQNQIGELKTQISDAASQTNPMDSLFTPEQEALIGKETLDAIGIALKASTDANVKPLQDQLAEEKRSRMEADKKRLQADRVALHKEFLAKLEVAAPNYGAIDKNPNFLQWMKQPDTTSGQIRSILFANAQRAGDVQRVAEFFLEFEKLSTPVDKLAGKVTPTASAPAPAAQVAQPATSTITPQFIEKFYDDVVRGKYRGRQKQQQEIEEMIDNHLRASAGAVG